jgi:hypothetical protein
LDESAGLPICGVAQSVYIQVVGPVIKDEAVSSANACGPPLEKASSVAEEAAMPPTETETFFQDSNPK